MHINIREEIPGKRDPSFAKIRMVTCSTRQQTLHR